MTNRYYYERTKAWMLDNKIIVFLSLLSFCLFVSTLALAGQKNRLNDEINDLRNSLTSTTPILTTVTDKPAVEGDKVTDGGNADNGEAGGGDGENNGGGEAGNNGDGESIESGATATEAGDTGGNNVTDGVNTDKDESVTKGEENVTEGNNKVDEDQEIKPSADRILDGFETDSRSFDSVMLEKLGVWS